MTAPAKRRSSAKARPAKDAFGEKTSSLGRLPAQRGLPKPANEPEPQPHAEPEPWPPPAPVINGRRCVELTTLPLVGTLVVKMRRTGPQIGIVSPYEHFHPTQYMFPVRWGVTTSMEAVCPRTWMLPMADQPEERRAPRRTGMCAQMDLEAAQQRAAQATALH